MSPTRDPARVLLQRARDDAHFLTAVFNDRSISDWIYGFHAQQAIEKALKAVLSSKGIEYPRTHDLTELIAMVADTGVPRPPDHDKLDELTPYGSTLRYGDDSESERSFDRGWVRGCVERTLTWAARLVEPAP